jgi:phage terminase large subunit-like protein
MMRADAYLDAASLARWRSDPVAFIEEALHDPETRKPYRLLPAERAFLEHAFQTDAGGRLKYPEQVYACPKKSGKTAFAAMHCLTTTLLFGGAYPEATICANDLEQSVGRVFEAIRKIITCSPLLRAEAKITESRITFPAISATIMAIASDYAGAAGGNQCVSCFDELWGYTSERSRRLWDEMVPPPTRKVACRMTTTYAGFEGESALLEELHKRGRALPCVGSDLHAGDGLLMFWSHEPVAPWQDERWLAEMRRSLRPNAYLRMIENRFVSSESTFIDMSWWDACVDPAVTPLVAQHSLPVTVGIDASVKRDSTAIVAVTWDRQRQKVVLLWHRIYQPTPDDPLDFEAAVEATVLDLHSRFLVRQALYDPYQMTAVSQRLQRAGVRMEEYPQNVPNLTASSQNLYELIKGRNIVSYPDPQLRLALSRAVAVESARGWKISKDKQTHKIDVVVALAMAALAAIQSQSKYRYDASLNWVRGDADTEAADYLRQRLETHILRTGGYYQQRRWL